MVEYTYWWKSFLKNWAQDNRKLAYMYYKPNILEDLVACISKRRRNVLYSTQSYYNNLLQLSNVYFPSFDKFSRVTTLSLHPVSYLLTFEIRVSTLYASFRTWHSWATHQWLVWSPSGQFAACMLDYGCVRRRTIPIPVRLCAAIVCAKRSYSCWEKLRLCKLLSCRLSLISSCSLSKWFFWVLHMSE